MRTRIDVYRRGGTRLRARRAGAYARGDTAAALGEGKTRVADQHLAGRPMAVYSGDQSLEVRQSSRDDDASVAVPKNGDPK